MAGLLVQRLIGTNNDDTSKLAILAAMAAAREHGRGLLSVPQVQAFSAFSQAEKDDIATLLSNIVSGTLDATEAIDVLILGEMGFYPADYVEARLGLVP